MTVFFAGFQTTDFAVGSDTDSSAGRSFIFTNQDSAIIDPNSLGTVSLGGEFSSLGFSGNALIRVVGISEISAIPEPSVTMAFVGLLVLPMIGSRRRTI